MDTKSTVSSEPPLFRCRICLEIIVNGPAFQVSRIAELVKDTLEINVKDSEQIFPNSVCFMCQSQIVNFYSFKQMVVKQNDFLVRFVGKQNYGGSVIQPTNEETIEHSSFSMVEEIAKCQVIQVPEFDAKQRISTQFYSHQTDTKFDNTSSQIVDDGPINLESKFGIIDNVSQQFPKPDPYLIEGLDLSLRKTSENDSDKENTGLSQNNVFVYNEALMREEVTKQKIDEQEGTLSGSVSSDVFYDKDEYPLVIDEEPEVKYDLVRSHSISLPLQPNVEYDRVGSHTTSLPLQPNVGPQPNCDILPHAIISPVAGLQAALQPGPSEQRFHIKSLLACPPNIKEQKVLGDNTAKNGDQDSEAYSNGSSFRTLYINEEHSGLTQPLILKHHSTISPILHKGYTYENTGFYLDIESMTHNIDSTIVHIFCQLSTRISYT